MKRTHASTGLLSGLAGLSAALQPLLALAPAWSQDQVAPLRKRLAAPAAQAPADQAELAPIVDRDSLPVDVTPSGASHPEMARVPSSSAFEPVEDSQWDGWTREERTNIRVYERANRGVVNITTKTIRPDHFMMAVIDTDGTGSGTILDKQGHILTNLHVVEGAREIRVSLYNGEDFEAGLVGQDPVNDIAVLRIAAPAELLNPIPLCDAERMRVGQKVYAIGNPFGLERTLTVGIVSSLNRSLPSRNGRTMKSIIQIDAALNRGNSGGPLLDSRARLIGMNTAIASNTGENTGVGFAIPVGTIQRVVRELIQNGRVVRPTAGIAHVHPTDVGLVVAALIPGGPAEQAGLRGFRVLRQQRQRGAFLYERTVVDRSYADIITAVAGNPVATFDDLLTAVEQREPGDQLTITVLRDGQSKDLTVLLVAED
jgi:S1-C subfamily serine protease